MKNTLQSQLDSFKKENSRSSKEAMLTTVNSMAGSMTNNDAVTSSIESVRRTLSSRFTNQNDVVQSVENLLSNLE